MVAPASRLLNLRKLQRLYRVVHAQGINLFGERKLQLLALAPDLVFLVSNVAFFASAFKAQSELLLAHDFSVIFLLVGQRLGGITPGRLLLLSGT